MPITAITLRPARPAVAPDAEAGSRSRCSCVTSGLRLWRGRMVVPLESDAVKGVGERSVIPPCRGQIEKRYRWPCPASRSSWLRQARTSMRAVHRGDAQHGHLATREHAVPGVPARRCTDILDMATRVTGDDDASHQRLGEANLKLGRGTWQGLASTNVGAPSHE